MLHVLLKLSMGVQYTRFTTFVIVAETEARSRFVVCGERKKSCMFEAEKSLNFALKQPLRSREKKELHVRS